MILWAGTKIVLRERHNYDSGQLFHHTTCAWGAFLVAQRADELHESSFVCCAASGPTETGAHHRYVHFSPIITKNWCGGISHSLAVVSAVHPDLSDPLYVDMDQKCKNCTGI